MPGRIVSPKPAIHDVVSYLDAVREALHDEPAKYDEVIKIFDDFQLSRVDICQCLRLLEPLFEDHLNLLRGFKYFPPDADADEAEAKINALFFVREVKKQFVDEPAKYEEFTKIMVDFREDRIDETSTNARVMEIIKDHENLVLSYQAFGPPPVQPTIPINAEQQTDEPLDKKD